MSTRTLRYLVDTNVLLRSIEPAHPHHEAAQNALRALSATAELFCTSQNLIECHAVATRPKAARGLGMTPKTSLANLARFQIVADLLPDTPDVFHEWQRLVVEYSVSGIPSYDARLVAAMRVHRLSHILTFNGEDFRRYENSRREGTKKEKREGIAVIDPHTISPE